MVLDIGVGIEGYTEVELDGILSGVTSRMRSSQERFIRPYTEISVKFHHIGMANQKDSLCWLPTSYASRMQLKTR